jgi:2-phosphosulfolactate phosphatase
MRIEVVFTPVGLTPAEVHGRSVFVVDILRATTVMCAAMSHGAKALIPVGSTEEALRLAQTIGKTEVLLAGEKNCLRIPGFDLGNSPLDMTELAVRNKTIILTTTNGTKALLACQGAEGVYPTAAANLTLTADRAREALENRQDILIVCAGRAEAFALDDAYCAGRLIAAMLRDRRSRRGLNDAAVASLDLVRRYGPDWERPLSRSRGGRELIKLGLGADVQDAARQDGYPVLCQFHERRVTLHSVHA